MFSLWWVYVLEKNRRGIRYLFPTWLCVRNRRGILYRNRAELIQMCQVTASYFSPFIPFTLYLDHLTFWVNLIRLFLYRIWCNRRNMSALDGEPNSRKLPNCNDNDSLHSKTFQFNNDSVLKYSQPEWWDCPVLVQLLLLFSGWFCGCFLDCFGMVCGNFLDALVWIFCAGYEKRFQLFFGLFLNICELFSTMVMSRNLPKVFGQI